MDRSQYPSACFAYIEGDIRLFLHHDPETITDGQDHDSVNIELLEFCLSNLDMLPVFGQKGVETKKSIKAHLIEHVQALGYTYDDAKRKLDQEIERGKKFGNEKTKTWHIEPGNPERVVHEPIQYPADFLERAEEAEIEKSEGAKWTTKFINDLPDSSFAVVEKGGEKDEEGKTVPRTYRHLPFKGPDGKVDLPHLRNALARMNQIKAESPEDSTERIREVARKKLIAAAKEYLPNSKWAKNESAIVEQLKSSKAALKDVVEEGSVKYFRVEVGEEQENEDMPAPHSVYFFAVKYDGEGQPFAVQMDNYPVPTQFIPDIIEFLESISG